MAATSTRRGALLPLLIVVLAVGWLWSPLARLPFTGEDYVILARIDQGGVGSPHVFRPVPDAWLDLLYGSFGPDEAAPYHLGSLLLHLLNTSLVYLLALALFASAWAAGAVAVIFGLGSGAFDSLAWIAAVNRPWSTFGALLAFVGVLRVRERPRAAALLVGAGYSVQFLSNEEVYGTTLLLLGWLGWSAGPGPRVADNRASDRRIGRRSSRHRRPDAFHPGDARRLQARATGAAAPWRLVAG